MSRIAGAKAKAKAATENNSGNSSTAPNNSGSSSSSDAKNNPAILSGGVHSESMPLAQPGDISLPESGPLTRTNETIVPADATALDKNYADALKFNEDVLEIMLEPSSEENAPTVIDVTVNGETVWIPVGQSIRIKRKFVEVLMRSKPVAVSTAHEDIGAKVINNRIVRNTRAKYPLSIMNDPAQGKGVEWMRRIRAEL